MSSCLGSALSAEEKERMRGIREQQLREEFRNAIVRDLLTLYTTPSAVHGENPVDALLESMDRVLDLDRKRIFISVLKDAIPILEAACDAQSGNS